MTDLCYLAPVAGSPLADQRRLLAAVAGRAVAERAGARPDGPGPAFVRLLAAVQAASAGGGVEVWVADPAVLGAGAAQRAAAWAVLAGGGARVRLAPGGEVLGAAALIEAWAARPWAERRAERVRRAMGDRALRGEALGRPPAGYRVERHRLVPDPAEAEVIREMFRLAAEERLGTRRIAQRLQAAGLRTRRGGAWSAASIGGVLRNPVYEGTYRRRGVVIPQAHEALVPRARFREVQALLDGRRVGGGAVRRARPYLFAGLVRCAACGGPMVGSRRPAADGRRPATVIYRCEGYLNGGRCGAGTTREEALVTAVRRAAREATAPAAEVDPLAPHPHDGAAATTPAAADPPLAAAFERRVERLLSLAAGGRMTAAQLERQLLAAGAREGERLRLAEATARAERRAGALTPRAAAARLRARWERLSGVERAALLRRSVREIRAGADGIAVRLAR